MQIYLFQAFASNNSGSYTIVGTFRDAATAESVAKVLSEVSAAHSKWHEEHAWDQDGSSPLDEFVQQFGLRDSKPGRDDEWPEHGDDPTVLALDYQVLVHAPYTVTMPRAIGEFFYAKGGRVQVELNHAHDDLAVEFTYWAHYDDPAKKEKLDAFQARLEKELGPLTTRGEHDSRPPIEPAWIGGTWGGRQLFVIFRDILEGVAMFGQLAKEMGISFRLDVRESPRNVRDPFASLRGSTIPGGVATIILWQVGERIAAMKAVREVLKCGLEEAKQALADLPAEILVGIDVLHAKEAVEILERAGCDAEVVVPVRRDD